LKCINAQQLTCKFKDDQKNDLNLQQMRKDQKKD